VCSPSRVAEVFVALDGWAVAASREEQGQILLLQAEAFRRAGCESAARASLERVLVLFPTREGAPWRAEALRGLQTLPPPFSRHRPFARPA